MSISAIFLPPALGLAQPAELRGVAPPGFVLVERVEPGVGAGLGERARDERAHRDVDVVRDPDMADDHRRAADRYVAADVGAAGDADAARDRAVRADAHVVANLDLVVELDALLDHRVVERAAVDRGVGADLDVVADAHAPDLRDLHPATPLATLVAALLARDAEAVGA